ncbi:hypothetical protein BGZ72_002260, partial [Mortierella alpina]
PVYNLNTKAPPPQVRLFPALVKGHPTLAQSRFTTLPGQTTFDLSTHANQAFEALQVRVIAIYEGLTNQASPAFNGLTNRIQSLEDNLTTYGPILELLDVNRDLFADLPRKLEPRCVSIEAQLTALDVVNKFNTFSEDMFRGLKTLAEATKTQSISKPRIDSPEKFSGKREDWKSFQSQLELFFLAQASQYLTEAAKIIFAISRLGDTAAF